MTTYHSNTEVLTLNQHVVPESMVALVNERRKTLPVKYSEEKVRKIAQLVHDWGRIFSIPSIFVAAQILHETGFFSFTGDVVPEQNNFAGIGTTGGGVQGHWFKDENAGVLAVYVHHSVYLRGDPRFWHESIRQYGTKEYNPRLPVVLEAVKRLGTVKTIGDYSGRWAVGPRYHETIIKIMGMMQVVGTPEVPIHEKEVPMKVRVSHIPWNNPNRTRLKALPSGRGYITVHETGNFNNGANAEMHRKFTHNGGGAGNVSFNYVLDSTGDVIELVPRGERTWQASDGHDGPGNSSVSIECCVNADGDWNQTKKVLARFLAWLIENDSNLSHDRIVQHNTWARDNKNCPTRLRANNNREFNEVLADTKKLLKEQEGPMTPIMDDPNALVVNGHWIITDILHAWRGLDEQTLPMIGYPVSGMFEGPVSHVEGETYVFRPVQIFERGALAVYYEGTPDGVPQDHPFRVRNLTPTERNYVLEWGKKNGFVGPKVT